jgi:hypothetical protein
MINQAELTAAINEMRHAGEEMDKERGGEFSFGEWSGESEREVIENVTGLDYDDLSPEDIDELCNAFLGC